MSNRQKGNELERIVADILAKKGYWVHNFNLGRAGQPVDLIAVKNCEAKIIEVKDCSKEFFEPHRIEDNQYLSIGKWWSCNWNKNAYFAIRINEQIYIVDAEKIIETERRLTEIDLNIMGVKIEHFN